MAQQELLLLQILKIPVLVIKFLGKLLSILTYLPNYLFLLMVDHFLFDERYQSSQVRYMLMWFPRLVLLVLSVCLFCGEFYGIFYVLELEEHGLILQMVGMIFTLAGLLILMRKGYLSLTQKYHLSRLKSVKEHLQLAFYFGVDGLSIIMTIINIILVVNINKIWQYRYTTDGHFYYLKFIVGSVRQTIIIYIQFVYVRIIFRVFPWRFDLEVDTYRKEKDQNNVLNCLVLLTLTYIFTLTDIICIASFGSFNCIHYRRKQYIQALRLTPIKWKATLVHFWFAFCQTIELMIEILMLPICWAESKNCMSLLLGYTQQKDLFGREFQSLLIKCSIRLPYFICNILIAVLVYKYKRRNLLVKQFRQNRNKLSQKQFMIQNQLIVQYTTFQCFGQQFVDIFLIFPFLLATVTKPWRLDFFRYCMSSDYKLNRSLIIWYMMRNIIEIAILPLAIVINLILALYRYKQPYLNYQLASQSIQYRYQHRLLQQDNSNMQQLVWPYFEKGSWIALLLKISWSTLIHDLPHLPLYFLLKITQLTLFSKKIQPSQAFNLIYKLYGEYYHLTVISSQKKQFYQSMNQRMKTNKTIRNEEQNTKFWKLAYKCQKFILIQKITCLFLKQRSINRIRQKIKKGNNLSQFSNQYWYQYQLAKAYILKLIFLIIQLIVSLIGFLFLLPLTLWRLPTFIKLYLRYKDKRYFFPILFAMYKQMLYDIITIPLKLVVIVIAPKMYFQFILRTSFEYGPSGLQTFKQYQVIKRRYLKKSIFENNFFLMINGLQILVIYFTWIRINTLKAQLKKIERKSVFLFFKQYIWISPKVVSMQIMKQSIQSRDRQARYSKQDLQNIKQSEQSRKQNQLMKKVKRIILCINQVFGIALVDFPYLIIIALLFITMPWRINYIIQAIRDTRKDSYERKSFIRLLKNIGKDYLCIALNIILLLSGFKTKKSLFLIRRNYRLNFIKGFLQYSYFQQLVKQLISLFDIYRNVFLFLVACAFCWTRSHLLIHELRDHRKKLKEEEEYAAQNKRIYQNTVKENKQRNLLNKMGFYNYISLCSYLTIPDIISLRNVDSLNYQLSKREEVWFTKWQTMYASKHNFIDEEFEARCKKAYIQQKFANPREIISYNSIIMLHFNKNVSQQYVSINQFTKERLPQKVYKYLFVDYSYAFHEGYGPQNELPQQQHQDQQFLRLTNQIRRPKVQLIQNVGYLNLLFYKPIEKIIQAMHSHLRYDGDRRKKQAVFILVIISFIIFTLYVFFDQLGRILWLQDRFIGLRLLFLIYLGIFQYLLFLRGSYKLFEWVSLNPFDLYYDFVRALKYVKEQIIIKKVVSPTTKLSKKIWAFIKLVVGKVVDKIKKVGQKTADITVKYSLMAYEKVIKPLYLKIADIIRKIRDVFVLVFSKIFKTLKIIVNAIYSFTVNILKGIYNGIYAIFSNLNKLYYLILEKSMKFLLKFGLIGNLVFTIFGLFLMTLPSIVWWQLYPQRWYLIVSTIHTMVLIVTGYKNLNRIRSST